MIPGGGAGPTSAGGRRSRPALHAAAVSGLFLVVALRWWPSLAHPGPLNDELVYLAAAHRVADGRSPFAGDSYLYPSLTATLLAAGIDRFGEQASLVALRCLDRLGLAVLAWGSACMLGWRRARAWLLAAAFLCVAPAVGFALFTANTSPLAAGLTAVGLWAWARRPLAAGAAIGVGIALKPLAWATLPLLGAHRAGDRAGRARTAAFVGATVAAALVLLPAYGPDFFAAIGDRQAPLGRSASLHRLAHLAGADAWAPAISLAVVAAAVVAGRHRRLAPDELTGLAVGAAVAATPVVWSHTLLLTLPLQAVAWRRTRAAGSTLRTTVAAVGILALQLSEGVTGIDHRGVVLQAVAVLPTALAPLVLAGLVVLCRPAAGTAADGRGRER